LSRVTSVRLDAEECVNIAGASSANALLVNIHAVDLHEAAAWCGVKNGRKDRDRQSQQQQQEACCPCWYPYQCLTISHKYLYRPRPALVFDHTGS
jgi:hypothetical protein